MTINFLIFLILMVLCQNILAGLTTYTLNPLQKSYGALLSRGSILQTYKAIPSNNVLQAPLLETMPPNYENRITKSPDIVTDIPQYDFNYHVHDPVTGDIKHHTEKRLGDMTSGVYTILDADGFQRTVTYTADDENGFKAIVDRQPLLHNAMFEADNTYRNVASKSQFHTLRSGQVFAPSVMANAVVLPSVYQTSSDIVATPNAIYHQKVFDIPLQQSHKLQVPIQNYQQYQLQQQIQQPLLDIGLIQTASNDTSSSYDYHQSQHQQQAQQQQSQQQHHHHQQQQQQQELQSYPENQPFVLPFPQQLEEQQQHQQQFHQPMKIETNNNNNNKDNNKDNDDDDSEIVEARFATKQNEKQQ